MTSVYAIMWACVAGFLSLLLLNLAAVWRAFRRKKRERQAVEQLVKQLQQQEKTRHEATGAFLEELYQLEGDELTKAITTIDSSEKVFFGYLVELFQNRQLDDLSSVDAKLAEVVDCYKQLKPKHFEAGGDARSLQAENETLKNELEITRNTMAGMMAEFGNMFGGGQETRIAEQEVIEQLQQPPNAADEMVESGSGSGSQESIDLSEAVTQAVPLPENRLREPTPEPEMEDVADIISMDDIAAAQGSLEDDTSEDDLLAALGSIEGMEEPQK